MTDKEKEILAGELTETFIMFLKELKTLSKQVITEMDFNNNSKPHAEVMHYIKQHGKCKMTDIGKDMGVTKSYVTALVDKLEKQGYLYRDCDLNDRRIILISLTKKGDDVFKEYRRRFARVLIERMENIPDKELSTIKEALKLIEKFNSASLI